ncbi:MAG: hypothetical protein INR62_11345, partial [Rhodospirillales bacterium]|nr:hypothetical protein [Acetobacter sp.]
MNDLKTKCISSRFLLTALVLFAVTSCGGGGDQTIATAGGDAPAHDHPAAYSKDIAATGGLTITKALQGAIVRPLVLSPFNLRPSAVPPNSIRLQSDPDDWVGGGRSYEYLRTNSLLSVVAKNGTLEVNVRGDESWTGSFALPRSITRLQAGTYTNLVGNAITAPVNGGLDWYGNGRSCISTSVSSLTIRSVAYDGDALQSIDLLFEQHCEGKPAALRGEMFWSIFDRSVPPGPVSPPPLELWSPAPGATPATGTYIYLESEAGDYIGQGEKHSYGFQDAVMGVVARPQLLDRGDELLHEGDALLLRDAAGHPVELVLVRAAGDA